MRMWSRSVTTLMVVTALGCDGGAKDTAGGKEEPSGGDGACALSSVEGYRTVERDGVTREVILHVPAGYDAQTPAPVVFAFHGNAGCADQFAAYEAQLEATADRHGFLLVYPQGVAREKGNAEWDPGDNTSSSIQDNDLRFADAILDDIQAEYSVDSEQVYAVGYSNGGMMAYGLACRRGQRFAAAGIMSGIMLGDTCDEGVYTSILHLHGTNDGALPYEGNQDFSSVASVMSFWVSHNGTRAEPETSDLGGGVSRDAYTGGREQTEVVLYTIENGDHVWFSDAIGGEDPNEMLWTFLANHQLSGPASE